MFKLIKKSKSEQGFTIIEVMIVLAIAALILLIVFLAVPALQRSSRNTQRKNDGSGIASLISNFVGDNNGTLPNGFGIPSAGQIQACATGGTTTGAVGATTCTASGNVETGKIGYYTGPGVWVNSAATTANVITPTTTTVGAEATNKVSTNSVLIIFNESCPNTSGGNASYTARDAAVFYATEAGGTANGSLQCVDS